MKVLIMNTNESKTRTFLIEKGPAPINYFPTIFCTFVVFFVFISAIFVFSGKKDDTFLFPVIVCSLIASTLYALSAKMFFKKHKVIAILKAVGHVEDEQDLGKGLLWAETEGWPVCEALNLAKFGFTLEKYHAHIRAIAEELSKKLSDLSPGEEYDKVIAELTKIHDTESWKILTKKEGEEREARRIKQEIKRLEGNTI